MVTVREKVQISKSKVAELLASGVEKDVIREENYPQLNKSQWNKALKAMGLSSVRAKKVEFVIEDETTKSLEQLVQEALAD